MPQDHKFLLHVTHSRKSTWVRLSMSVLKTVNSLSHYRISRTIARNAPASASMDTPALRLWSAEDAVGVREIKPPHADYFRLSPEEIVSMPIPETFGEKNAVQYEVVSEKDEFNVR